MPPACARNGAVYRGYHFARALRQTQGARLHSTPGYRSLNPLGSFTPVMLDSDLALLYGVTTGNFNKAVQRNAARFPAEFSFVLTRKEFTDLMCQIGTSKERRQTAR